MGNASRSAMNAAGESRLSRRLPVTTKASNPASCASTEIPKSIRAAQCERNQLAAINIYRAAAPEVKIKVSAFTCTASISNSIEAVALAIICFLAHGIIRYTPLFNLHGVLQFRDRPEYVICGSKPLPAHLVVTGAIIGCGASYEPKSAYLYLPADDNLAGHRGEGFQPIQR